MAKTKTTTRTTKRDREKFKTPDPVGFKDEAEKEAYLKKQAEK